LGVHFGAGDATAQDAGGGLDFPSGKPMRHVGMAAFAALSAFSLFLTCRTHKSAQDGGIEPAKTPLEMGEMPFSASKIRNCLIFIFMLL
jgi:hypothetical protein